MTLTEGSSERCTPDLFNCFTPCFARSLAVGPHSVDRKIERKDENSIEQAFKFCHKLEQVPVMLSQSW